MLIGHDWGALAAYAAAGHAPERWSRVVVAAVPPPATVAQAFFSYDQLQRSWYMFFFQSPLSDMAVPMDDLAFIDRLWQDWSPGLRRRRRRRPGQGLHARPGQPHRRARLLPGHARRRRPRREDYDAIEARRRRSAPDAGLYLHGADDGCMGAELIDDGVLASLPAAGSRFEVVPGTGHFLQLEEPATVNRLILDFLAG